MKKNFRKLHAIPFVTWVSEKLNRKIIIAILLIAFAFWGVLCVYFVNILANFTARFYGLPSDPAAAASFRSFVFFTLLLLNIAVFIALVVFLYVFLFLPIGHLRLTVRNYSDRGEKPNRSERKDELGKLQNAFVDLTEEVERKEANNRQLIASISHDIKTPLTSILGYSERLMSASLPEEKRRRYLQNIHEKAIALRNIVDEFDGYLDVGLHSDVPMTVRTAAEVCEEIGKEYSDELADAGVLFDIECDDPSLRILCNRDYLLRLFGNLINNSLNHGGAEQPHLSLHCFREDECLAFAFSDNGHGVPREMLSEIFEPLVTSDKGRKVSGLGLAICKSIVSAHGGVITAENIPSGGFTVRMSFPLVEIAGM